MKKGTSRYAERVGIFLNVEKSVRELAKILKLTDSEAYTRGVLSVADVRVNELNEQQFSISIQHDREILKEVQDRIAMKERVNLDLRIRSEARARQKKRTVVMVDERGRQYEAVMAE